MGSGSCTLLVLGHLPSVDNLEARRSRDLDADPASVQTCRANAAGALPLLRCFGRLIHVTYCPTSLRHAQSARLLTEMLAIADPMEDARLNNIDYGMYKGLPAVETPSMTKTPHLPYEGGDSWNDVLGRWQEFCRDVLPGHDRQTVLLAGQSATAVRMLRHICNQVPLAEALSEDVPNIPFFSPATDFPTRNIVWHYSWPGE